MAERRSDHSPCMSSDSDPDLPDDEGDPDDDPRPRPRPWWTGALRWCLGGVAVGALVVLLAAR